MRRHADYAGAGLQVSICGTSFQGRPAHKRDNREKLDTKAKRASVAVMVKGLAVLFLTSTALYAQNNPTAYDALRTVGNQFGRDAVEHVISVSGVDGNPQPATWRVSLADPGGHGIREVEVTNGRMTSQKTHSPAGTVQGAAIDTTKLNLDSSGAYEVASRTADSSHVPFALVSYTLHNDQHGSPTWVIALQSQNRRPVGTIYIGANKGTVTRTEGMFQGIPQDAIVEQGSNGDIQYEEGRAGPIKQRLREMFERARDSAQDTFKRVRHNFADYIRGQD